MVKALIFLQLAADEAQSALDDVRDISGVQWAYLLFGPVDGIAQIDAEDINKLTDVVFEISSVDGVRGTDTRIVAS